MENLRLFEKPAPVWVRFNGSSGTCGAIFVHESGWKVIHCGHPTANFPYYLETPSGEMRVAPNGRGFRLLAEAKKTVELITKYSVNPETTTKEVYGKELTNGNREETRVRV